MNETFKRKFDGPLQQPGMREPIKDPILFSFLVMECQALLMTAIEAPGKTLTDLVNAATNRQEVEGVQFHRENFEKALKRADQLIEMEPLRGIPWMLKAQSLLGLGRLSEALAACDRAIEIDPSDPVKWDFKGQILEFMGETEKAKRAKQHAEELVL